MLWSYELKLVLQHQICDPSHLHFINTYLSQKNCTTITHQEEYSYLYDT